MHELSSIPRALPPEPAPDPEADEVTEAVIGDREVAAVATRVRDDDARTVEEQILLASTPAPPFGEEERGRVMARLLTDSGAEEPWVDGVGNVLAWLGPSGPRPFVVGAHLDTVFPASQEIVIRREGDRWIGPGVSDDARGLAALLALARALSSMGRSLGYPLLLAATVGEEGVGDLRGVRHLFGPEGAAADARGFVSLDGAGSARVIASGVGSRRFRATVAGPGGHSWVDWGRVNPVQILARGVAAFGEVELPPGATVNVGRIAGGTSVNAIPTEVWVEYETRSEREAELAGVERLLTGALQEAVAEENRRLATSPDLRATLRIERIGDRPAGTTAPDTKLVRAAVAATRALRGCADLAASSTDANFPMSLGIPSITLGAGGEAGEAHTTHEWYRNTSGPEGVLRALYTVLVLERLEV